MRKRLLAALCCIMMLLPFAATAETELVPQLSAWQLEESASPIRVTASAQMSAWVPFDDTMLEALNTLLSHMSVQVDTMNLSGETWSKTALLLDSEESVSLTQRQAENQRLLNASFLPEQTLTSAVDPTALLLGDGAALNVPGYTGEEQAWVAEAKRLMQELPTLLADWKKEESVSKKIAKSGTAKTLYTFKLGKDDAAQLGTILAGAAQNSMVKAFLSSLTFSKAQAIKLYTDAEGQVLRFAYEGRCGVTTQRKVTISWNMKDDGESARDSLTVKSPAVSGSDKDSLTWLRELDTSKSKRTLTASFTYTAVHSKVKTTLEGEADLTYKQNGGVLTGEAWIKQTDRDGDSETWIARPELTFADAQEAPAVQGGVQLTHKQNKRVAEDMTLTLSMAAGESFSWEMRGTETKLDELSAESLTALQEDGAKRMAAQVLRAMLTLPQEDLAFIQKGLSQEAWQRILNALGGV